MEGPAGKSAKNNSLNTPKNISTKNTKKSNKEIREEYFNKLRSWLSTVNNYQCYYNKLQQDLIKKKNKQVSKNPTAIPKVVPNNVPETPNIGSTQFVGMFCLFIDLY